MPLPFSIFTDYRTGSADSSARPEPVDAVGVFEEWLAERATRDAADRGISDIVTAAGPGVEAGGKALVQSAGADSDPGPPAAEINAGGTPVGLGIRTSEAPVLRAIITGKTSVAPEAGKVPVTAEADALESVGAGVVMESMNKISDDLTPTSPEDQSLLFRVNPLLKSPAPLPVIGGSVEARMASQPLTPEIRVKQVSDEPARPEPVRVEPVRMEPVRAEKAKADLTPMVPLMDEWPPNQAPNQISNRELAQLRLDTRREIDEVKNDLFGAAMGVNALKDRLDGLEAQVVSQAMKTVAEPSAAPTREEIQSWVHEWLKAHLPDAVQAAVAKAMETATENVTATLSSSEFFRLPIRSQNHHPVALFSQAPSILSSRPS